VEVDGQTRSYLLALPADLSAPAPVILDLHGLGESGAEQVSYSGLSGQGPAAGMIVATPNSDNGANSWTLPVLGKKDSDFMAALLDQLEATRCVDRSRETVAGISNGAGLSDGLICALDGRLAAIFPVSGVNILRPCATAKPTTIIAFHGTADPIVPYAGGPVTLPAGSPLAATLPKVALPTVEATAAGWAQNFGCRAPVDTSPAADIRLRTFSGCGSNATVELYTVNGGGHTWPGATLGATRTKVLGATTHSISATQIIVAAVGTLTTRR
jgi:polyhydroxybutyrate depolymerase